MARFYVVGDIHGCLEQLQRLIELCEKDAASHKSTFIFSGDYIDRGPDSRGVIDFLIDLRKWSPDHIVCLRGNHEDLLLSAPDGEDAELNWLANGGDATLRSYRTSHAKDLPATHVDWVRSLPLFHDALAIPGGGPVLGSLNLIFFSSSMTPEAAAKKYLGSMKLAVKDIERRWSSANKARGKIG